MDVHGVVVRGSRNGSFAGVASVAGRAPAVARPDVKKRVQDDL